MSALAAVALAAALLGKGGAPPEDGGLELRGALQEGAEPHVNDEEEFASLVPS